MTPELVLTIAEKALTLIVMLTAPLLLSSLAVGLLVAMFQAATQINEMTLTFIPKLIVMVVVIMMSGDWMIQILMDFTIGLFEGIPAMVNE
ncbi:MAG: flagellar biosynthesis protein FliQ [Gammaproteobacteria bacterium]|nr:flagellar biosynthesis protein FliQ [Gammaproteobacteria bacterium]